MTLRFVTLSLVCLGLALLSTGCKNVPGRPGSEPEVGRPEQLVSFRPLYEQNCAGCHGSEGKSGAAISLANPLYLAIAGKANIERITRDGVAGTMMPAFGHLAGGMLTDQQIAVLAQGMVEAVGAPQCGGRCDCSTVSECFRRRSGAGSEGLYCLLRSLPRHRCCRYRNR